jgi:hypothetical protein
MTQKSERKQGYSARSWLFAMASFTIVLAALSGIRTISLSTALVVAVVVVVAGVILLKVVK